MDDRDVEMVDLDDIGLGKNNRANLGPDGKPMNLYGASNADRNFVKRFMTQTQIGKAEKEAEDAIMQKQKVKGNAGKWFGKMNFSQGYMAEL